MAFRQGIKQLWKHHFTRKKCYLHPTLLNQFTTSKHVSMNRNKLFGNRSVIQHHCGIHVISCYSQKKGQTSVSLQDEDEINDDDLGKNVPKVLMKRYGQTIVDFINDADTPEFEFTTSYFKTLEEKESSEKRRQSKLFDAVMILLYRKGKLNIAEVLIDYLKEKGQTMGIVQRIFYIGLLGNTNQNHCHDERIFSQYNECLKITDIFDHRSLCILSRAFSTTSQWKKCLEFVEMAKITTKSTLSVLKPLLLAALENRDFQYFNSLFDPACESKLMDTDSNPVQSVLQKYIDVCGEEKQSDRLEHLFSLLRKHCIFLNEDVSGGLKIHLLNVSGCEVKDAVVNKSGVCSNCGGKLDSSNLSHEEFKTLQDKFLDNTLLDGNAFYWTTPKELKSFKDFLDQNGPFDYILDGLNIYYQKGSTTLKNVIDHFARDGKKVLVIMRKHHQKKYPNCKVFTVDNSTKDDFFMLYTALKSGYSCMFVTRDYLRDSKYKMQECGEIFQKWQRCRQISYKGVLNSNQIILQMPQKYDPRAQKNGDVWHIPYSKQDKTNNYVSYRTPNTFLCVQNFKSH